ncbi:hypothetical protein Tco_1454517 [Tanacetum coccineum]
MNRHGYSSIGRFDVFFCNQLLVFQQHQDESLYDSWTRFKYIIRKVPNHDLSIWTLIEIFLKHIDSLSRHIINLTTEGDLRKFSDIRACWDDMVRVLVPRCMAWLDYDKHVDSLIIKEYLVKVNERHAFWSLNEDILKINDSDYQYAVFIKKIRRIRACTHQRPRRKQDQYAVSREDQYAVLEIYLDCRLPYDDKGGVVVLTLWIEKMEFVHDMSGCSIDRKVKYTASSFVVIME